MVPRVTPPLGDGPPVPPSRARAQRRLDLAFRRTLVVTVAFPLLALATLAGVSLGQLDGLLSAFDAVEHSDRVIGDANETLRALVDMETGLRGYLITEDERFLEPYRAGLPTVRAQFEELGSLVADNQSQSAILATWRAHAEAWIATTEAEIQQAHGGNDIGLAARMLDRKARMDAVRDDFATFLSEAETQRSSRSSRAQRTASSVLRTGLLLTLLIGAACAVLFARQLFTITRTFRETLANEQSARDAAETSERRYSSLVAATTSLVYTADSEGRFVAPQHPWAQYTGQSWDEHRGYGWQDAFHPEDQERVRSTWREAHASRSVFVIEARLRHVASDTYHWVVGRAVPVLAPDGAAREWIGTVIDVDDRLRAERERDSLLEREQLARGAAESANRAKDQFLAMVSHELRNPLSPILAWSRLLQSPDLDEAKRVQGLQAIERGARSQAQLIGDLLDISRIVSGKLRLDVRPLDLVPVIEAAIETVRPSADARQIRLSVILDPRSGPIAGDPERLQQVAWNLLSNAVKFTPKGGRITVQLARINSHVELTVSDTGEGIPPDLLPHVFERFWQAEGGTTRQRGGLGLGLAIVRHLVELHGGTVAVESEGAGRGTIFRVNLPLMAVTSDVHDPGRRHPTGEDGVPAIEHPIRLERVRVLVVDDEPDTVAVVQALLALQGADVRTARSTPEALAVLDEWRPDVLVSDIGMPEEDGYALIARVRARTDSASGAIPAVALTAYARVEDRIRVLAAGFDMHVAKPIDPGELVAVVARLAQTTVGARVE
jgi:PAS domain S-box-containing protein